MLDTTRSVSEITSYISHLFTDDPILQDVWIRGEVSNMTRAKSGHWYFTLKDSDAQLKCVMWRTSATRQRMTPAEGDEIAVHGKLGLYAPRGEYQLYADTIQAVGLGDLYQQFERLKAQLEAEGLFAVERKQAIPAAPAVIGIVTSPDAAALQDVLNVLRRRYPLAHVVLSPTPVQGLEAPPSIVRAIERLNAVPAIDVILLVRGGGSIEDLSVFNAESVARAIAASARPIISGVGHETDFTIADFVADLRAPTPSAAAELATPDGEALRRDLAAYSAYLTNQIRERLAEKLSLLDRARRDLRYLEPSQPIANYRQHIDALLGRLGSATANRLTMQAARVDATRRALENANPANLLARGYAIVTRRADGTRIRSIDAVHPGDPLAIRLLDGTLFARVEVEDEDKDSPDDRGHQPTLI